MDKLAQFARRTRLSNNLEVTMSVKLILRDKTYDLKPGMTLRSCLEKLEHLLGKS